VVRLVGIAVAALAIILTAVTAENPPPALLIVQDHEQRS
jgi:hypothetical protein